MLSAILHVEDDLSLRGLVELAFQGFGFRGTVFHASSVSEAHDCLEEAQKNAHRIDLVLTDMNLPDGSGLDVVRDIRASPTWKFTPVLILSGDVNPKLVGRAYALGANAYIDKSPRGRTLAEVIKSLYEHWSKDAVLPCKREPNRTERHLVVAIDLRRRHAQLYHRFVDRFGDRRAEAAFWLSRALAEANLVNLLELLHQHLNGRELPEYVSDGVDEMQDRVIRALSAAEQAIEQPSITRDEAYAHVVDDVATMNPEALARTISYLFPVMPIAMEAARDVLVNIIEDVAAWIEIHATDPALRTRAAQLRTLTIPLTNQLGPLPQ